MYKYCADIWRNWKSVVSLMLLSTVAPSALADLIGVRNTAPWQWQLSRIDKATGQISTARPLLSGLGLYADSTVDETISNYYLNSSDGINVIDLQSGVLKGTLNSRVNNIQASGGNLYGLENVGYMAWQFERIDPNTGSITKLGDPLTGFGIFAGDSTIDGATKTYYQNTSDGVKMIDVQSGQLKGSFSSRVNNIQASGGNLYGLENVGYMAWQFERIDPNTGSITNLGSPLSGISFFFGDAAIDGVNDLYYLNSSGEINIIDLRYGQLVGKYSANVLNIEVVGVSSVPEPRTAAMASLGILLLWWRRRRVLARV